MSDLSLEEREQRLQNAWEARSGFQFLRAFSDILTDPETNEIASEFVRNKIREKVDDTDVAETLCPKTHPLGTKRPCLDDGYFETFNRDNVSLVDVRANPIISVTSQGVRTTQGDHDLDVLIFATGFDAMTGSLLRMNVKGVGGVPLAESWEDGPRNYLGLMVSGFPNLFMIHGPGSPSVLAQMVTTGEWQVDWIAERIRDLEDSGLRSIEPTRQAEDSWEEEVQAMADSTLFKRADSWYVGANIEGKPRVFMVYIGGFDRYKELCEQAVQGDYRGFVLS